MAPKIWILLLLLLLLQFSSSSNWLQLLAVSGSTSNFDYPAVFNFGDSNSDTGGYVAGMGKRIGLPYGQTYFHKPTGRICDGRLTIDFLMDAMGLPLLNPYLNSIGAPSFRTGCNFAAAGCTVLPATASSVCPFSLGIQVAQFQRLKDQVLQLQSETEELDKYLPPEVYFTKALYILDMGQNDLDGDFHSMTLHQVLTLIQKIVAEFEASIKALYDHGARHFWVHNMGPGGCLAMTISKHGSDPSKLDELGCVSVFNQVAKLFNQQLHELCQKLQSQYFDADFTFIDIFTIKLDVVANYSLYGFKEPIMACCGYGGPPLNYDSRFPCGSGNVCKDSSEYVSWDGVHLTDAANQFVASRILTGKYSDSKMLSLLKLK